jgi:hypothetical protein
MSESRPASVRAWVGLWVESLSHPAPVAWRACSEAGRGSYPPPYTKESFYGRGWPAPRESRLEITRTP